MLVISQAPPPTHGSTIMTKILLEVLAEDGWRTHLVDRRFSRAVGQVGAFSLRKVLAVPSLVLRLVLAVTRRPAVCIFFCTNRPFSFLVDLCLGEVLRLFRVPTVNYIHTSGYRDLAARGALWRSLVRRLLSHGDRTVCLAESLIQDVEPFVRQGSTVVISNTIDAPATATVDRAPKTEAPRPEQLVLFLSNLLEEKGADVFVDMAIALCDRSPDLTFALVGQDGDQLLADDLRRRVALSGHGDRVKFLGARFGAEKWAVLAQAQLLVFPSRYRFEAQPLTIIEAFSHGVPVVASDVGAIREMVNDENGYLLPEPTAREAVRAVELLFGDSARRRRSSDGARKTFLARHSRQVFQKAWRDIMSSVQEGAS